MRHRPWLTTLLLLLAAGGVVAVGCAKRPAVTQASAPAPTGAVESFEAPPPAAPIPAPVPAAPEPARALAPPAVVAAPPAPPAPAPAEFVEEPRVKPIYFDFDKYAIRPDAARTLDANLDWIQSNPGALILIEGHCDERGTNAYNLALGEQRARATMSYLTSHGVAAERIRMISYGEERPVCTERNETCWAKNRRAHFLVRLESARR